MDMAEFPGWSTSFDLLWRQEISRHASGVTRVKDFGRPVWRGSWVSKMLRPNELDQWRAWVDSLSYGLETFEVTPPGRCWPQAHPNGQNPAVSNWVMRTGVWGGNGVWLTGAPWDGPFGDDPFGGVTVASVGADNSSVVLDGADDLVLTPGDVIGIADHVYRVVSVGASIGLKPYLWPGVAAGAEVTIHEPKVTMRIDPGSVSISAGLNGRGTVSFSAYEAV